MCLSLCVYMCMCTCVYVCVCVCACVRACVRVFVIGTYVCMHMAAIMHVNLYHTVLLDTYIF